MPDRDFNYTPVDASEKAVAKGGVACPFPWRLHEMLKIAREENLEHVVSWCPHGKAFTVHKPIEFVDLLMTRYVSLTCEGLPKLTPTCNLFSEKLVHTSPFISHLLLSSLTDSFANPNLPAFSVN